MENEELLNQAEKLLKDGKYDEAQNALYSVTDKTAKWYFFAEPHRLLARVDERMQKNLETAIEKDPENEEYKGVYEKIKGYADDARSENEKLLNPYNTVDGKKGFWAECCCEGCGECGIAVCCELTCESVCNGF